MRLFLAITLPDAWKDALARAAAVLRAAGGTGTFTRRDNFHLTLVFLGEVDDPAPVMAAMDRVSVPPFSLRAAAPGLFRRREGDVRWVGLEPCPGLDALQSLLCTQLRAAGHFVEDRPFRPHLTLGQRVSLPPGFDRRALEAVLPPLELAVDSFALMRSERAGGALTYTPLYRRYLS